MLDTKSIIRSYGLLKAFRIEMRHAIFLFNKLILRRKWIKRKIHDYKMYLGLWMKGISWHLYLYGTREEDHKEIFHAEIKEGYKILDIGANIGYYALMEAMLSGKNGMVHAVEPDPRNLELLTANISLNKLNNTIQTYDIAISNKNGTKDFGVHTKSNLNVLLSEKRDCSQDRYVKILAVKTVDIYDFLQTIGKVNLIRMDIEGHEVEIFEGIIRLFKKKTQFVPDKIVFEVHTENYHDNNYNMRDILGELIMNGYRIKTLTSQDEEHSKIKDLGYTPWICTYSDEHKRGLYNNIQEDDALKLICDTGGVRIALLSRD